MLATITYGEAALLALGSVIYVYIMVRIVCLALHRSAAERQKDPRSK